MKRRILTYNLFESRKDLSQEQVDWLDKCTRESLSGWKLNPDTGLIDIYGTFDCSGQELIDFKGVRFGTVSRNFHCNDNQLTSLDGAPEKVGGSFYGYDNHLTSLKGSPKDVGEAFWCTGNQLTSLEGAPEKVGWNFACNNNPVSGVTLESIYNIMESGKSYQDALIEYWKEMPEEDKILMYKDNTKLSADEKRGYELMDKVSSRTY
jgi:hypothetical protein